MKKKYAKGYVEKVNDNGTIIGAVGSTDSTDRDGEILKSDGWILDNFKKNSPLLWSHDARELPIGKVLDVRVEKGALKFDAEFAENENPFAKKVADLMRSGFLKAFSVGFMPLEQDSENDKIFTKNELLEISVVNVPANADALVSREYKEFKTELDKMKEELTDEQIEKIIKKTEKKSPACRQTNETSQQCVSRKIPELKKEGMNQEQAVATAINICKKPCKTYKEGRVLSETNKILIRNIIATTKDLSIALEELLARSESPKGFKIKKVDPRKADKEILKALRIVDRAVEIAIHRAKKGNKVWTF